MLAYRYEGLRESDFEQALRSLCDMMDMEQGPYGKRKACRPGGRGPERQPLASRIARR